MQASGFRAAGGTDQRAGFERRCQRARARAKALLVEAARTPGSYAGPGGGSSGDHSNGGDGGDKAARWMVHGRLDDVRNCTFKPSRTAHCVRVSNQVPTSP